MRKIMKTVLAITVAASGLLILASAKSERAGIEAGQGGALPSIDLANLTDRAETIMNQLTEQRADVDAAIAGANIAAFLDMLKQAEGTKGSPDPYAVCYGYSWTVHDFRDHPALTGEWGGQLLSDSMCKNAGFGPGCKSTAAGAYQITRGTWRSLKEALGLPDFGPASQDAAAVELIRRRGALEDVKAGRVEQAISKCRNEWASLPGNYAAQGQRSQADLVAWYQQSGGTTA